MVAVPPKPHLGLCISDIIPQSFLSQQKKDILEFGENLKIYLGKRAARTDVSLADYVAQL